MVPQGCRRLRPRAGRRPGADLARTCATTALPLYLARPFCRTEYILGKIAVLVILLSAITWVPGLLLFLLQAYLGGLRLVRATTSASALAIFVGSLDLDPAALRCSAWRCRPT